MATILQDFSYRYQWLHYGISPLAVLSIDSKLHFH